MLIAKTMRGAKPSRRAVAVAVAVVMTVSLTGCGAPLDGLVHGREAKVSAVTSGDAVVLEGGESVRLAGIEAPHGDAPGADESREALERLVLGRRVALAFGGARRDAYGRTLAQVERADGRTWLEGALIGAGEVRVRLYADNRALAAPMLAAEAEARRARRGLWALPAYAVRLPEEVAASDTGLVLVEGRVRRAARADGRVYLDFLEDGRPGFTAEIPVDALRDFRAAGLDPLALRGRLVRVRGTIRADSLGAAITLDAPENLEVLRG